MTTVRDSPGMRPHASRQKTATDTISPIAAKSANVDMTGSWTEKGTDPQKEKEKGTDTREEKGGGAIAILKESITIGDRDRILNAHILLSKTFWMPSLGGWFFLRLKTKKKNLFGYEAALFLISIFRSSHPELRILHMH
jgi:hypothetical protein